MKKNMLIATLLTAVVLSIGFVSSSYAEEIYVSDSNGTYVGEIDVPDKIDGRTFSEYIPNSNFVVYTQESEVPYRWDSYVYDINTLKPAAGGWYIYSTERGYIGQPDTHDWYYVMPGGSGYLVTDSWILDNGLVYLTNSKGVTRMGEIITIDDLTDSVDDGVFNVQTNQFDWFEFSQRGNKGMIVLSSSGTTTYDNLMKEVSGQANAERTVRIEREARERAAQQSTQSDSDKDKDLDWYMFDLYIDRAMADRGHAGDYEILGRIEISHTYFSGVASYKVRIPSLHSIKTLNIYINDDGSYYRSSL